MRLSPFRLDVTPPLGHPLCGGWIAPATEIVDRLWANGLVLHLPDGPVVLVAVDWCEIRNAGHDEWREAIAAAVGTSIERVAVQCVHPHDAPFADPRAERLLRECGAPGSSLDLEFFQRAARSVADAAGAAAAAAGEVVTHVGTGECRVPEVASNRRISGPDGKVGRMRGSSCRDEPLRAAPAGLIDEFLKTVTFWNEGRLLASLHYYATHPMSHYGQGGVSGDFCALSRDQAARHWGGAHLYFTGCAGNVGAGKYNDGSPAMRGVLQGRVHFAMLEARLRGGRRPLERAAWHSLPVQLPTRPEFTEAEYLNLLHHGETHLERYRGATGLSWLRRSQAGRAIDLSCLALNDARILHLPGEPFVEYQLAAQQLRPDRFVAVAGYGDCGPGYIPTAAAYEEGGYEAGWAALVGPESEKALLEGMRQLLDDAG